MGCRSVFTKSIIFLLLLILFPYSFNRTLQLHVQDLLYSLDDKPFAVGTSLLSLNYMVYCKFDMVCTKRKIAHKLADVYGWEAGRGKYYGPTGAILTHFSHAQYKAVTYNPNARRLVTQFLGSKVAELPEGFFAEGVSPTLLQLDTNNPEHKKRRVALADSLPALAQDAKDDEFLTLPDIKMGNFAENEKVYSLMAYNLFNWMFGIDVAEDLANLYEYDGMQKMAVIGKFGNDTKSAARMVEIRKPIEDRLLASEAGKTLISNFEKQGLDPLPRTREVLQIALFAGYGGTGTISTQCIALVLEDPLKHIPLFRKNPTAFMLECARFRCPVGGMNPAAALKTEKFVFANGVTFDLKEGDQIGTLNSAANLDPTVFEDPDAFRPGRKEAERILTWNNEIADQRKCATVAGCAEAPRGCPGTFLALRLATKVVEFFVEGISDAMPGGNSEL